MKFRVWLAAAAVVFGMFAGVTAAAAEAVAWQTDFAAAQQQAQKEQRPLLVLFTGSDWCGYCIQLEAHVLNQPEFAEFVQETKAIPVKLDFPARKLQGAEVRQQNKKLQQKYKVNGFPTMFVMDGGGKVLGRIEGFAGLAEDYLAELRSKMPQR